MYICLHVCKNSYSRTINCMPLQFHVIILSNLGPSEEVDYVSTINRVLPGDIRVVAWSPVDVQFDAR
jgi:hypothetical protein